MSDKITLGGGDYLYGKDNLLPDIFLIKEKYKLYTREEMFEATNAAYIEGAQYQPDANYFNFTLAKGHKEWFDEKYPI